MHITIVLPYGVFEESNLQYQAYLARTARILKENNTDIVMFCGGYTNKNLPHLSEATSVLRYLQQNINNLSKHFIEERSLTTPQNLEFVRDILVQEKITPTKLSIICDSIRAPKVFFLAHDYFGKLLEKSVEEKELYRFLLEEGLVKERDITKDVSFDFKHIHIHGIALQRSKQEIGHQVIATMEEIVFSKYPELHASYIQARKKLWGIEDK